MFLAAARLIPWLSATVLAACVMSAVADDKAPATAPDDVEFTLRVLPRNDDNGEAQALTDQDLDRTKQILGKRIKAYSPNKAAITIRKPDTISIRIPSLTREKSAAIRHLLTKAAKLELREVSRRTNETRPDGKTLAQLVMDGVEIVPGYRAYMHQHKDDDGHETPTPILLSRRVALNGTDVAQAFPSPQQPDAVAVTLNGKGTEKMIALTTPMQPGRDRIAIVLDGHVLSAPVVNAVPLGREFIIEGLLGPGEVQMLANALMNPLENTLELVEMRTVSSSLKK